MALPQVEEPRKEDIEPQGAGPVDPVDTLVDDALPSWLLTDVLCYNQDRVEGQAEASLVELEDQVQELRRQGEEDDAEALSMAVDNTSSPTGACSTASVVPTRSSPKSIQVDTGGSREQRGAWDDDRVAAFDPMSALVQLAAEAISERDSRSPSLAESSDATSPRMLEEEPAMSQRQDDRRKRSVPCAGEEEHIVLCKRHKGETIREEVDSMCIELRGIITAAR